MDGQMIEDDRSSTWSYGYDQSTFAQTSTLDPDGDVTAISMTPRGTTDPREPLGETTSPSYNGLMTRPATRCPWAPCARP